MKIEDEPRPTVSADPTTRVDPAVHVDPTAAVDLTAWVDPAAAVDPEIARLRATLAPTADARGAVTTPPTTSGNRQPAANSAPNRTYFER